MDFFLEEDNIWTAASDGNLTQVQKLIEQKGINMNAQDESGYSALHASASYGEINVLEYLLSIGADHTIRDEDGDTPLLVCEHSDVFERLILAGADPTIKNYSNAGIVEKAVENDAEELIHYLIEKGYITDPNFSYVPSNMDDEEQIDLDNCIQEGDHEDESDDNNSMTAQ